MLMSTFLLMTAPVPAMAGSNSKAFDPDKIVCRTQFEVYSRIPERVCRSAGLWLQLQKENDEALREAARFRQSGDHSANPIPE